MNIVNTIKKRKKHNGNGAVILIVDDNADNRLLLSSQLMLSGYKIIEAHSGQQGIDKAHSDKPDLILLDVMMPIMNGFEVCTQLKNDEQTSAIPVIIITALREIEYRIRGIEAGADEFLSRPHHREELLVRVRSLIRLKQARDKLEEERNRLQLLYDVTRATTNYQLDLNEVMSQSIVHTQAAVGATKGSIMLISEEGEVTHKILIRAGLSAEMTEHVTQSVLKNGLAGWLIRNKKADIIGNIQQDSRWITLPDDTDEIHSVIGVPLLSEGRVIGVIILTHPQQNYFQPEHVALLETIAAQVSTAMRNAFLFNETMEQQRKLEAILSQSTDAIITTDESHQLIIINQAATQLFGIEASAFLGKSLYNVAALNVLVPLFKRAGNQPIAKEVAVPDERILFASVTPIPSVGFLAVMQDVTEMKRIEQVRLDQERREKQMVKDTFSRYMSPRLVDQVLSAEPSLFGRRQRRRAVVMFADLRGFTRMIVGLKPDTSIAILNEFFSQMTAVVYKYDGTIFDLAGDELMVGFNVPFDQYDAGYRAVCTAVAMQRRFEAMRQEWFFQTNTDLGLGIGIDEGDVVMGNVGAETRMNFAMVGEAVNTAHRLVDIAQDGQIIISDSVHHSYINKEGLRPAEHSLFQSIGKLSLKGKPTPQLIYRAALRRHPLK